MMFELRGKFWKNKTQHNKKIPCWLFKNILTN